MHLNKILDQIKHHPSPTEAIDKLGKALEKHEGSLLEKGFQILKSELCANVYEAINGPHFDEEHARYAVEGKEVIMFPFMFNPYFGRNNTVRILDQVIPKINTISVSDSTESTVLGICPKVWCRLPREGVFVLEVRHTPATASATLPVFVSTTGSVSTASNNNNIPVVKGDSTPLVGSEISAGNRYWVYYNKCDNVIQVMNHYTVAAAPAA